MCSSFLASLFPLAAIIVSLMYAVNQKKRIVSVANQISPKQRRKDNISSDSIQSFMEYEEQNSSIGFDEEDSDEKDGD